MTPDTEPPASVAKPLKKPRVSFLLATWFGLGYLPKAPGTWGSLAGVYLSWLLIRFTPHLDFLPRDIYLHDHYFVVSWNILACFWLLVSVIGVFTSSRVAVYSVAKDPQFVVIDEVSGQMLTLLLGLATTARYADGMSNFAPDHLWHGGARWTVLLAGFVFFRLFDIWKPFPIRHLEKLPGGWGIMADDWFAGIYAAILLRLALHFNLL
jgi:phosphatidylglycerophosphatase A